MKYIIVLILLLQVNVFAQDKTQLDRKYLTVLIYLKTNNEIRDKIISFQKHWTKNNRRNVEADDNFNLSKYIVYLPIPKISEENSKSSFVFGDINQTENRYFETTEIESFNNLLPANNSKFYLFYSKPIGDYLIAEMLLLSSGEEIDQLSHKEGPAMNIIFVFDEDDIVQKVYVSSSYYN